DFGGFVPGTNTQPAGWAFSYSLLGQTPPKVTPTDDATIYNLTWHYVGGPGLPIQIKGPQALGLFSAESTTNLMKEGEFAAEATKNTGPFSGTPVDNIGSVAVPIPEMSALLPTLGVCVLGGIAYASSYLRKRARS
ncbi:MAG: hypothetical protein JO354_08310, partial [Verrucomicrobia bacterium]|nr:hypothetical protein [Verrucomicrobiota bacterium]